MPASWALVPATFPFEDDVDYYCGCYFYVVHDDDDDDDDVDDDI